MQMCSVLAYNEINFSQGIAMADDNESILERLKTKLREYIDNLEEEILDILAFEIDHRDLNWSINDLIARYHEVEAYF
jgi:hypothetical protein